MGLPSEWLHGRHGDMERPVKAPRRPPGWVAPGPRPLGNEGRPELEPADDEDLSYLAGDWRLFQKRQGHRWSLDDLVTADVGADEAQALGADRLLDLGCGQGSVVLLLAWRFPEARLWGIEAQGDRAAMARRSADYNGASGRVQVTTGDLRDPATLGELPLFPVITGTPPYFPRGTGTESDKAHAMPCRFEFRGGVEAYVDAAAARLAPDGRVVLCIATLARGRIEAAAKARGLCLTRRVEVIPREGKAPLIDVEVLSRFPDELRTSRLVVRDRSLAWTAAFKELRARFGMPTQPP